MRKLPGTLLLSLLILWSGAAQAQTRLLYILDASNSMWGQIDGTAKIDTARKVLRDSLAGLPDKVTPGLMLYGHRRKGDCSDVELRAPFGAASRAEIMEMIQGITPRGKTPISRALGMAGEAFGDGAEGNRSVLLISDGIETCGENACAAAERLAREGIGLQINVIGFDVDREAREQLQCIARAGNGRYFDARSASEFQVAVAEVQKQVQAAPAPEPSAPKAEPESPETWFMEDFDGPALSPEWRVINPDEENYLVEDGFLTIVAGDGTPPGLPDGSNVLRLEKPIPRGDWTLTARIVLAPRMLGEAMRLGIGREDGSGIFATAFFNTYNKVRTDLNLVGEKLPPPGGTGARFDRTLYYVDSRNLQARARFFAANIAAVQLRLQKKGRKYTASMKLEPAPGAQAAPDGKWAEVQALSALKLPGDAFYLSFGGAASDYLPDNGEGVARVDWVRVERP